MLANIASAFWASAAMRTTDRLIKGRDMTPASLQTLIETTQGSINTLEQEATSDKENAAQFYLMTAAALLKDAKTDAEV